MASLLSSDTAIDSAQTQSSSIAAPIGFVRMLAVCSCFVLSGIAALIYQTAWTRQFALVFGTSELAVAAVLAAYMCGLALGAALVERFIQRITRPLVWYAGLELGIAISAAALIPAGLWLAEHALIALFGHQTAPPAAAHSATTLFYLLSSFVVLLVPTTLMGATLPLLARFAVRAEQHIGQRIGLLYACNTAGAVVGALLGALILLPQFGLQRTIWIAAAVNVAVSLLAVALAQSSSSAAPLSTAQAAPKFASFSFTASPAWVLPLMLLSGAVSFLHEVLWTRMLSHVLGSSIYAFGIMLASFLAGIALGGGLGAWLARRRESAARWLAISELGAAVAAVGAWYALQKLSSGSVDTLSQRMTFSFLLLFPLAFAIGVTYPLAVRILALKVEDAAPASARVYSWNTVGAIVGAIAGGFLIIPALRYEGSVRLAVIASCVLAVCAAFVLFRPSKRFGLPLLAASLAVAIVFSPQAPDALLRYSSIKVNGSGEMLFYSVGRSAAVTALRQGEQIMIRTNGLPEASVDTQGTPPSAYVEAWMAPVTVLARPQTRDMLVVGFGGGRVLEAVPPTVSNIDVIELEDKVIDANRLIGERRVRNPLNDPRINVIVNDARGALTLTDKRYDAIVSQPSHPWTAGASHLYTREFMQQAKAHLNPGGVFSQWMNIDFLDESLLRSLVATLTDVFPYVRVYRPALPTLIFLASDQPIEPELQIGATRSAFAAAPGHYSQLGLNVVEDLVMDLVMDNDSARRFGAGQPLITDDANRFATHSVFDFGDNLSASATSRLLADYDPLQQENNPIYQRLHDKLAFEYIISRLSSWVRSDQNIGYRLVGMCAALHREDLQIYLQSLLLQSTAQSAAARELLENGLRKYPDNKLLQDALLSAYAGELGSGQASKDVSALAAQVRDESAVVLEANSHAAHDEWDGVAKLDDALAEVPWTSIWSGQAMQLRVEWRVRVRNPELRGKLGLESLQITDRLSTIAPTPQMFALRAWSAAAASQPLSILESINRFAVTAIQTVGNDPANRAVIRNYLVSMQQLMTQLKSDSHVDRTRYEEVLAKLNQIAQMVS